MHVPADTRADVWNPDRARELGAARGEEDNDENYGVAAAATTSKSKIKEDPPARKLAEIRMRSEPTADRAVYMLAVVRDGELHLHPVSRTLQFRPTMSYLDVLARKTKPRRHGADSDSDDGPPPDPDEPPPPPTAKAKSKAAPEAREVQLSVKKANDDKMAQALGGLTQVRKDMLIKLREEAEETWEDWDYRDSDTQQAHESLDKIVSQSREPLKCDTTTSKFYRDVPGSWF